MRYRVILPEMRAGFTIDEVFNLTKFDIWFLVQIKEIVDFEEELAMLISCRRAATEKLKRRLWLSWFKWQKMKGTA